MTRRAMRPNLQSSPSDPIVPPARPRRWLWLCVMLPALGGIVWVATSQHRLPAPQAAVAASPLPRAGEADLLAVVSDHVRMFRLRLAPQVLVMIFPSLTAQGLTLNRIGAFVEKAGTPHDHVLSDAALAQAIAASHNTVETFYYAHDYRAADLARFFAAARAEGIALRPDEISLKNILQREGVLAPGAVGALISLPQSSGDATLDARARAGILRHEISHGIYFTDRAYATFVAHFWHDIMTADQRARFRRFLVADQYDSSNEDLMQNEMQAYLVHTPDSRFFSAGAVGMTQAQIDTLRASFVQGMPQSSLRDLDAQRP